MDQPDIAGIAELSAPIAGSVAAGADPRSDVSPASLYYRLRDARADARAQERAADNDPAAPESGLRHWKLVADLAVETLQRRGKDIEVASWLTEGLVRLHGLAGLAAGAELLCALVDGYWNDGLFPVPDEVGPGGDSMEPRLAPIAGLSGVSGDGTLLQPLRKIVLFRDGADEDVTFWRFEQARAGATHADAEKRSASLARLTMLEETARGAGRAAIEIVARDARCAAAAWDALGQTLQAHIDDQSEGQDGPPMRRVRDLLDSIGKLVAAYAPSPAQPIPQAEANSQEPDHPAEMPKHAAAPFGRDAMLDEVLRIAARFREAEPNSPFSYTIEDAVRRARLPWPALLEEMMPDTGARNALLSGLGIRVAQS
jgi:type VI secretion system protein ImpA